MKILIIVFGIIIFSFLGLLISKIESKLSWKQVVTIKYKVMVIAPILNIVSNRIRRKKISLGKLYKLQNKLTDKLVNDL